MPAGNDLVPSNAPPFGALGYAHIFGTPLIQPLPLSARLRGEEGGARRAAPGG
jgi:hypothetical protein